jgi:hypothetical protein
LRHSAVASSGHVGDWNAQLFQRRATTPAPVTWMSRSAVFSKSAAGSFEPTAGITRATAILIKSPSAGSSAAR